MHDYQLTEIAKYTKAYRSRSYCMGGERKYFARFLIDKFHNEHSGDTLLDIGCGRGEIMSIANDIGFSRVRGTEIVKSLFSYVDVDFAFCDDLSIYNDNEFDIVTCFDVLEHIDNRDTIKCLKEIDRVSRQGVIVSINNFPSKIDGVEHHINIKDYEDWDILLKNHINGDAHRHKFNTKSAYWSINKCN